MKIISKVLLFILISYSYSYAVDYAVVDMIKIGQATKVGKSLESQMNKKRTELQTKFEAKDKALREEGQKLDASRNELSANALQSKAEALQAKAGQLRQDAAKENQALQASYQEALGQINQKLSQIINKVSRDNKYELVLNAATVLYSAENKDITAQIIKELDKQMPNVTVKFATGS